MRFRLTREPAFGYISDTLAMTNETRAIKPASVPATPVMASTLGAAVEAEADLTARVSAGTRPDSHCGHPRGDAVQRLNHGTYSEVA
jgi:hypothetical protein